MGVWVDVGDGVIVGVSVGVLVGVGDEVAVIEFVGEEVRVIVGVAEGVTGIVVIAESHISIHTFPARGFLSADVYSCKNGMNAKFIVAYLKKIFS